MQLKALDITPELIAGFDRIGYRHLPVDNARSAEGARHHARVRPLRRGSARDAAASRRARAVEDVRPDRPALLLTTRWQVATDSAVRASEAAANRNVGRLVEPGGGPSRPLAPSPHKTRGISMRRPLWIATAGLIAATCPRAGRRAAVLCSPRCQRPRIADDRLRCRLLCAVRAAHGLRHRPARPGLPARPRKHAKRDWQRRRARLRRNCRQCRHQRRAAEHQGRDARRRP